MNNTITIEQLAAQCDRVKWSGKHSFTARCLAHDDRNPSMSVTEASDGSLLLYCHSGCSQSELLEAAGFGSNRALASPIQRVKRPREVTSRTADYALELWAKAADGAASHPYSINKKITHDFGAKVVTASASRVGKDQFCIALPMRDWDAKVVGVELINADGVKQTMGPKGVLILGHPEEAKMIHIVEGWATAWGTCQLFPRPFACVVAFGSKMIPRVAAEANRRYRGRVIQHQDGSDNRDLWDLWDGNCAESYVRKVLREVSTNV